MSADQRPTLAAIVSHGLSSHERPAARASARHDKFRRRLCNGGSPRTTAVDSGEQHTRWLRHARAFARRCCQVAQQVGPTITPRRQVRRDPMTRRGVSLLVARPHGDQHGEPGESWHSGSRRATWNVRLPQRIRTNGIALFNRPMTANGAMRRNFRGTRPSRARERNQDYGRNGDAPECDGELRQLGTATFRRKTSRPTQRQGISSTSRLPTWSGG